MEPEVEPSPTDSGNIIAYLRLAEDLRREGRRHRLGADVDIGRISLEMARIWQRMTPDDREETNRLQDQAHRTRERVAQIDALRRAGVPEADEPEGEEEPESDYVPDENESTDPRGHLWYERNVPRRTVIPDFYNRALRRDVGFIPVEFIEFRRI